jgi:hypothetical protein
MSRCEGFAVSDNQQQSVPAVRCPGCQTAMRVVVVDSGSNDMHTATYRCDGCGMETQRTFKRDGKPSKPR